MPSNRRSAGLLMYRRGPEDLEVFLVHPGGPLYRGRDAGVWSIPKGELGPDEDPQAVARREFEEETGRSVDSCARDRALLPLGSIRQRSGKTVEAWAFEGDWPEGVAVESNGFTIEWPPRSRRTQTFPEVDEGRFFTAAEARRKINPDQAALIDRLLERLAEA